MGDEDFKTGCREELGSGAHIQRSQPVPGEHWSGDSPAEARRPDL